MNAVFRPRPLRAAQACAAFLLAASAGLAAQERVPAAAPADGSAAAPALLDLQQALRRLAETVLPVVVTVDTATSALDDPVGRPERDPLERDLLERDLRAPPIPGVGSGVLVRRDADRYFVLTNLHVVRDKERITVTLRDGRSLAAEIVGADDRIDLAMLAVRTTADLPLARLGDSGGVRTGDLVLAVGSPFGLDATLTLGIVSAVGRSGLQVGNISDFIQTDASMNPGNSGGPLVDISGRVVGINTWIQAQQDRSAGVGFALPIDNVKPVIDQLIEVGSVRYAWLGVSVIGPPIVDYLAPGRQGAVLYGVIAGQPADRAGLQAGDVVVAVAGRNVRGSDELIRAIGALEPNAPAELRLVRDGRERTVPVTPAVRDDDAEQAAAWPALRVQALDELTERARAARPAAGVYVTAAEGSGLEPGDTIVGIDGGSVADLRDFYRLINAKSEGVFVVQAVRGGGEVTVRLQR